MLAVKWEYRIRNIGCYNVSEAQEMFKTMGQDGWEFISSSQIGRGLNSEIIAIFKRPLGIK